MPAQIIQFPRQATARPSFVEWMAQEVGARWVVVKQRRSTWRGIDMSDRTQLLPREYAALAAKYEAAFGPRYAA